MLTHGNPWLVHLFHWSLLPIWSLLFSFSFYPTLEGVGGFVGEGANAPPLQSPWPHISMVCLFYPQDTLFLTSYQPLM